MRTHAVSAVALLALLPLAATAAEMPDLARLLDRGPRKEPAYVSKRPLYGLAAFGPRADKPVWMVLDQSRPAAGAYDVLYIDRDANGDLTGPGERLAARDGEFRLGDFTDPATGAKHTEFAVRVSGDRPDVMLRLRWRGGFRFGGGYPEEPDGGYMRFTSRPADAPVLWVWGDDPFRFQRWYGGKLPIGGSDDFKVFLGQPGRGPHTFCAAQEHILPEREFVRATLVYRDGMGRERQLVCELKERC
jgi:hypothetical protein